MPLRLCFIGPGVDAAEFVDIGVAQFCQSRGCRLAAVPAAAGHQNRGILFGDHLCGGIPLRIIHQRLEAEAKRLLLYTSKNAKEIADILGRHVSFSVFYSVPALTSVSS